MDRTYELNNKRKYVGLHGELLDRPWTAKKRRIDRPLDNDFSSRAGIPKEDLIQGSAHLLNDVRVVAKALRGGLSEYEMIKRFSGESCSHGELEAAKKKVECRKKEISSILLRCLTDLYHVAEETSLCVADVVDQTLQRPNWWEGENIFSGSMSPEDIEAFMEERPPTDMRAYSTYIAKQMSASLNPLKQSDVSWRRKEKFVRSVIQEIQRIHDSQLGPKYVFGLCVAFIVDVLLLHPRHIPLDINEFFRWRVEHILLESIAQLEGDSVVTVAGWDSVTKVLPVTKLALALRSIQSAVNAYPCALEHCAHANWCRILDAISEFSQREIRLNVITFVDDRLPNELIAMIFEATLAAERVGPPKLDNLKNGSDCGIYLKTDCEKAILNSRPDRQWDQLNDMRCRSPMFGDSDGSYDSDELDSDNDGDTASSENSDDEDDEDDEEADDDNN
ncbi:hypothetical protein BDV96DRAFT_682226 [Lophiotrema nucula]|uniref:Uncharacterized protein n=1 Tax=Lophiotrema nucula TaxID=690887 RepID=A0A6A5ZRY2_9PLEO|nr:hypothetical protein BDV96DRAFT_682226 [Lophiotrema nucula]